MSSTKTMKTVEIIVRDHPVTLIKEGRWAKVLTTQVPSTKGGEYTVNLFRSGVASCGCKASVYRQTCKHIQAVAQLAELGGIWK